MRDYIKILHRLESAAEKIQGDCYASGCEAAEEAAKATEETD